MYKLINAEERHLEQITPITPYFCRHSLKKALLAFTEISRKLNLPGQASK
jgi:hypothetical protein